MHLVSVRCHPFGAFEDKHLGLAPGLNVIYGPNEAGKSTLRAAIYAAFCGMRRGAGLKKEDRTFRDQHRPWSYLDWRVTAVLQLDDGTRVELQQDLDGRVSCSAIELNTGRDRTSEIERDGTPDAATWLGLDRHTFLSTACVVQGEIGRFDHDGSALQEQLQRAAATAGGAATAAAALGRLRAFREAETATERSRSKPLDQARERLRAARISVAQVEAARDAHLVRLEDLQRIEAEQAAADVDVDKIESSIVVRDARDNFRNAERVRSAYLEKRETFAQAAEQASQAERRVQSIETRIAALDARETLEAAIRDREDYVEHRQRVNELEQDLAASERALGCLQAAVALRDAESLRARLLAIEPLAIEFRAGGPNGADDADDAVEVAVALEQFRARPNPTAPVGRSLEELESALAQLEFEPPTESGSRRSSTARPLNTRLAFIGAGAAVLAGLALIVMSLWIPGSMLMLLGLIAAVAGRLWQPMDRVDAEEVAAQAAAILHIQLEQGRIETEMQARRERDRQFSDDFERRRAAETRLERVAVRLGINGAPVDDLATSLERWQAERVAVLREHDQAAIRWAQLQRLLGDSTVEQIRAQAIAAREKAAQLTQQFTKDEIERLSADVDLDERLSEAGRERQQSRSDRDAAQGALDAVERQFASHAVAGVQKLLDDRVALAREEANRAAARSESHDASDGHQPGGLRTALQTARDELDRFRRTQDEIGGELHALEHSLGVADEAAARQTLQRSVSAARERMETAERRLLEGSNDDTPLGGDLDSALLVARNRRERLLELRAATAGELRVDERRLHSVAEAQEELQVAQSECDRLEALDAVIGRTIDYIERAQAAVHRDIAPLLKERIQRWLPRIVGARYEEVTVDPQTLAVKVRAPGGQWRDAQRLSHGTREQIYLLLRVAMVEHLTAGSDEKCPLILDGITSECDEERKRQVLEMLRVLGEERQILLFSHERGVEQWAQEHLPTNALLTLDSSDVPA